MSIITLTDVKNELEIAAAETTFDARLQELIDDVIVEAEGEIGAKLSPVSSEVVYLDGGSHKLFIPHFNIGNVQIWADTDKVWDETRLIATTNYTVRGDRGVIELNGTAKFIEGNLNVKVQYDGGYTGPSLPKDLKRALITQIAYRWRRRKDPGLSAVSFPDGTVSKLNIDEWLPSVEKVLDRYRRIFL